MESANRIVITIAASRRPGTSWLPPPQVMAVWASIISFTAAVISNFLWNRYWTYPDSRSRPIPRQLVMFFLVNVAGLVIRLPILHFLELPIRGLFTRLDLAIPFTPLFLGKNVTLAIAVCIVMLWNFFVNRYWTYNDVDKKVVGPEPVVIEPPRH